jgi:molybdopterin-containing oxidoreductase family iron-sulfur binding subunit
VTKLKQSTLNFRLLEDLNTRPRTSYLVALNNPNPEIKEA